MTGNVTTDLFLEACSATGTLQVQMECQGKPAAEKIVPLPFIVVGRDEGCDLVLDDDQVSLRHAFFQVVGGRLFGVDLRSRTGTFWPNGAKASGSGHMFCISMTTDSKSFLRRNPISIPWPLPSRTAKACWK